MSSDSESDHFEDANSDIEPEQTARHHALDPFDFISRLDVKAYVGAGGAQNRSGLGLEKQEMERRDTEEWHIKNAERNRQILMLGNLVEDLDGLNGQEDDTLKFHKAGEAVFVPSLSLSVTAGAGLLCSF